MAANLAPSTVKIVEKSAAAAEEKLDGDADMDDGAPALMRPMSRFQSEEFRKGFSLSEPNPEEDVLENPTDFTGFSVQKENKTAKKGSKAAAAKGFSELLPTLQLKRQITTSHYALLKKVDRVKEEKEDTIEELEGWTIDAHQDIEPDPYAETKDVWAGLLLQCSKEKTGGGTIEQKVLLTTHGLGRWLIQEVKDSKPALIQLKSFPESGTSQSKQWHVQKAEIVRDKDKVGPFLKLTIGKDHEVNLYPVNKNDSANLKRFATDFDGAPSSMSSLAPPFLGATSVDTAKGAETSQKQTAQPGGNERPKL